MKMRVKFAACLLALALSAAGCAGGQKAAGPDAAKITDVVLATTTSTQDSGLLDELVPEFEKRYPHRVKTIAVGSGEALAMGRRGEADILLAHSPRSEEEFMADGHGASREAVMHNRFIIVGPKDDPANAAGAASLSEALRAISRSAGFVSRADDSGTHKKELKLWAAAAINPAGDWYIETGQGMGETLRVADQKNAYTLTDEATFLTAGSSVSSIAVRADEPGLKNPYTIIVVSAKAHPDVNRRGAEAFAAFITGKKGQALIRGFGTAEYGKGLFEPDAN
jgi:tungstate transport system substrate-binding protein